MTEIEEHFEISTGFLAVCAQTGMQAARLHHAEITPVHLLMALVAADPSECFATATLQRFKLTDSTLFEVVAVKIGKGDTPADAERRNSRELECVYDRARHDAIRCAYMYADSMILCRALLIVRDIGEIVRDCGADPMAIYDYLELELFGDREPPLRWTA